MSFPYLSDVVRAATGCDLPLPFATFGMFVACAMLAGGACLRAELRRLHVAGQIPMARRRGAVQVEKAPHEIVPDFTIAVMLAVWSAHACSISSSTRAVSPPRHGR